MRPENNFRPLKCKHLKRKLLKKSPFTPMSTSLSKISNTMNCTVRAELLENIGHSLGKNRIEFVSFISKWKHFQKKCDMSLSYRKNYGKFTWVLVSYLRLEAFGAFFLKSMLWHVNYQLTLQMRQTHFTVSMIQYSIKNFSDICSSNRKPLMAFDPNPMGWH